MRALNYDITQYPLYNKLFQLLYCLFAFSLPYPMIWNNYVVGVLIFVWLVGGNFKNRWANLKQQKLFFLFISLFILLLVWLYGNNSPEGGSFIERSLALLLLPLVIFSSGPYSKNTIYSVLKFYIAGCMISMIICFIVALYKHSLINYDFEWNIFTIELNHIMDVSHPYYGMYLVFACFSIIYLYNKQPDNIRLWMVIGFMAISILFMLAITSKIAFLAFLFITLIIGFLTIDIQKNIFKIVPSLILATCFIIFIFTQIDYVKLRFTQGFQLSYSNIINSDTDYSSTRMGPIKCALTIIEENWLFGVGTGDQDMAMAECFHKLGLDKLSRYNSHNQYLDYLMTYGITGLCLFLSCLIFPLLLAFRKKHLLYVSFILLFGICNLTENMMTRNKGILYYAFFNSLFACQLSGRLNEKG